VAAVWTGLGATLAVGDALDRLWAVVVLGLMSATGVDLLVFIVCFRLLTSADITVRAVLPGALVAAIGWLVLQAIRRISERSRTR
jgi:uncharacterized BrkB/YihY/UPF0761 family membrane protein